MMIGCDIVVCGCITRGSVLVLSYSLYVLPILQLFRYKCFRKSLDGGRDDHEATEGV